MQKRERGRSVCGGETDMQEGGALNRGSQVGVSVCGSLGAGPGCAVGTMKALASLDPLSSLGGSLPLSGSGSGCLGLVGVISRGSLGS